MKRRLCALRLACLAGACADDPGNGTAQVRIYGEAFIEEGIPAEDMRDGWEVRFSEFAVSLGEVAFGGVAVPKPAAAIDLVEPSASRGQLVGEVAVRAGRHGDASFAITRVAVRGTAQKGDVKKRFAWVFDDATHYARCETITRIPESATGVLQITVHADHLFHDSLDHAH